MSARGFRSVASPADTYDYTALQSYVKGEERKRRGIFNRCPNPNLPPSPLSPVSEAHRGQWGYLLGEARRRCSSVDRRIASTICDSRSGVIWSVYQTIPPGP